MQPIIEPNIHPILVHFAFALTISGAISLFIVSMLPQGVWRDTLKPAGDWMIAIGAFSIIATVAAGFQAFYSVAHDGPSHAAMTVHRNWAVPTASLILALGVWRWYSRSDRPSILFSALFLVAAAFLATTAWWGGRLVYGHGLGVSRMPVVTGEGHDREHAPGEGHNDDLAADEPSDHDTDAAHEHSDDDGHSAVEEAPRQDIAPDFSSDDYPETPEAVVDAYGAALRAGDEAAVRAMLAPDVLIAEGGGAERSLEEYAGHHMPADMAFTAAVDFTLKKRDVFADDNMATVISESQVHGEFRDSKIHSRMMETMVLRRINDHWRIVHIHWSPAPTMGEHEH